MKYRIHFEYPNGYEDELDLEGETRDEVIDEAEEAIAARGAKIVWVEQKS